jgi:hypothetical protein
LDKTPETVKIAIDRRAVIEMLDILSGMNSSEAFGALSLALSLLYRESAGEEIWLTVPQFTAKLGAQVEMMIANPPTGFREEDLNEPTPGCDCEVCQRLRARKEARANAH